ncbi:secretin N-terminal domain-containing protein [Piscinibacter gummiphilus]|uniref:Secretin N-terminal domain-containing protein n=1 Tax=Piscinibacter gummiphilus TaxID=946333 RepID=A0ABZ0D2S7_9BURK|nr:secretin N-terminal domain-containing protein [Piscinibacter gummiphilus]WOB09552.1 secretin N-terminal domain-containing protein [Piscinibacter gummiphilus]
MNTPRHALAAIAGTALLALAGCATEKIPQQATLDRIKEEMARASAREAAKPTTPPPDAVNRALLPLLATEPVKLPAPSEPRFDLAVSNAPAQQVFLQIVTGTRYSMLVAPEVTGVVALNLKNVTVREALDAMRDLYGYEYTMQGNRIHIQPNTLQTRIYQVNYLAAKRNGTSDTRVTSGSISSSNVNNTGGGGGSNNNSNTPSNNNSTPGSGNNGTATKVNGSHITTDSDNDFWAELRTTLTGLIGADNGRRVIVNPLSGVIAVRGFPQDLRTTENYLRMTQLIVERQVMIEAKIIEVQLSDSSSTGVNWSAFRNASSHLSMGPIGPGTTLQTPSATTPPTLPALVTSAIAGAAFGSLPGATLLTDSTNASSLFGLAFQSPNFAAMLQFLETQGNVQVLSSPRIASVNNQKAVLKVGTDEFFVTGITTTVTTSGTGNPIVTPTVTVQPFFSGIALDITPQIDENDQVILHLHPSVSVVAEKQKNLNLGSQIGTFQLPLASSTVSESDSVVRVQDGNIVAIGGLMKQAQSNAASGLPGTTDSVLGTAVGMRAKSGMKSELVILLKPTIIRNERSWQADAADTQDRLNQFQTRTR